MKKRFCLIGRELGFTGSSGSFVHDERLNEVIMWAKGNAFDGVAILSAIDGLVDPGGSSCSDSGMLLKMSKKSRKAWAKRVCDQAMLQWRLEGDSEFVLLCGVSGYQELAETLSNTVPSSSVTQPLAGTGIVRSKKSTRTDAEALTA